MNIDQFVARHCFTSSHLGGGKYLHSGYAMDLPETLRLPHHYPEMLEWKVGQQRVFVSSLDQAFITLGGNDITVLKVHSEEQFRDEFRRQSDYYIGLRRRQARGAATLPYHAKHAACQL